MISVGSEVRLRILSCGSELLRGRGVTASQETVEILAIKLPLEGLVDLLAVILNAEDTGFDLVLEEKSAGVSALRWRMEK